MHIGPLIFIGCRQLMIKGSPNHQPRPKKSQQQTEEAYMQSIVVGLQNETLYNGWRKTSTNEDHFGPWKLTGNNKESKTQIPFVRSKSQELTSNFLQSVKISSNKNNLIKSTSQTKNTNNPNREQVQLPVLRISQHQIFATKLSKKKNTHSLEPIRKIKVQPTTCTYSVLKRLRSKSEANIGRQLFLKWDRRHRENEVMVLNKGRIQQEIY